MVHHYKLVGTATEKDGEITFGRKYLLEYAKTQSSFPTVSKTLSAEEKLFIDKVIRDSGVRPLLKKAFSESDTEKILSLAFYTEKSAHCLA